jgi:hypothetical protein
LLSYQFEHFAHQNDLAEPKEYTKKMAIYQGTYHRDRGNREEI